MQDKQIRDEEAAEKKIYRAPQLITYGSLRELTQNGSQNAKENNGKGICGLGYTKSGSSSC